MAILFDIPKLTLRYKLSLYRQFIGRFFKSFFGHLFFYPFQFKNNAAGFYGKRVMVNAAFAAAHGHLCSFSGYGFVRKNPHPKLPPFFRYLIMALLAASIWRAVIHFVSKDLRPKVPKASSVPRVSIPLDLPFRHFLCFTFFGINIAMIL